MQQTLESSLKKGVAFPTCAIYIHLPLWEFNWKVVKQLALRMDSTVEENKEREAQLVTKELMLMGAAKM